MKENDTTGTKRTEAVILRLPPKHDHEGLQEMVRRMRAALADRDADSLYAQAKRLYLELLRHIDDEDRPEGLFGEIERAAPRFGFWLKRLRLQHSEIVETLRMVCAESSGDLSAVAPLVEECMTLLLQHERDEEELIEEVYFRDEGASD